MKRLSSTDQDDNTLINLPDPTNPQDAATKAYVDAEVAGAGGGSGDVVGPASSTDNAIARFDGTTGKLIQSSGVQITDGPAIIIGTTEITEDSGVIDFFDVSSELRTPVINELTAATGVTIDGLLLKDGLVDGRDVSADGTKLDGIEAGAQVNTVTASNSVSLTNKNLNSGTNTFPTFNQNTTGSAATLTTSRTFRTNLASTSTASFNGSANVTPGVTGTLPLGNGGTGQTTAAGLATVVGNLLMPIGFIYTSTASTNPGTALGFGTWTAFGAGRVMVGYDSGQTEFDTVEETGGAKTHTLTENEMPAHTHSIPRDLTGAAGTARYSASGSTISTGSTGGGAAHNNLQPYIVVHMFKRTA